MAQFDKDGNFINQYGPNKGNLVGGGAPNMAKNYRDITDPRDPSLLATGVVPALGPGGVPPAVPPPPGPTPPPTDTPGIPFGSRIISPQSGLPEGFERRDGVFTNIGVPQPIGGPVAGGGFYDTGGAVGAPEDTGGPAGLAGFIKRAGDQRISGAGERFLGDGSNVLGINEQGAQSALAPIGTAATAAGQAGVDMVRANTPSISYRGGGVSPAPAWAGTGPVRDLVQGVKAALAPPDAYTQNQGQYDIGPFSGDGGAQAGTQGLGDMVDYQQGGFGDVSPLPGVQAAGESAAEKAFGLSAMPDEMRRNYLSMLNDAALAGQNPQYLGEVAFSNNYNTARQLMEQDPTLGRSVQTRRARTFTSPSGKVYNIPEKVTETQRDPLEVIQGLSKMQMDAHKRGDARTYQMAQQMQNLMLGEMGTSEAVLKQSIANQKPGATRQSPVERAQEEALKASTKLYFEGKDSEDPLVRQQAMAQEAFLEEAGVIKRQQAKTAQRKEYAK